LHRLTPILIVAGLLAGGAAVAAVKPNTPTPMPRVRAEMKQIVDKTSTDLFNTAAEADPENGPDQKLPNAAGWTRVKLDADKLKAAAAWLQDPKNGKTHEAKWMASAKDMGRLAAAASTAAGAHDAKGLAKASNDLSDTCTACHSVYKKQE
jgi:cytochrome c556